VESSRGRLEAIPLEDTLAILKKYNALDWDETLPPTGRSAGIGSKDSR
jgi:hypothetical protein